ncbi:TPA: hypothetical protein ACKP22_000346 [Pseudomonas putida]
MREAHETQFKKLLKSGQAPKKAEVVVSANDGMLKDFNTIFDSSRVVEKDNTANLSAEALSSVYGKSIKSYISLTFREKGTDKIKGAASDFTFNGGTNFRVKAQAIVPKDMEIDTVALFEYTRLDSSKNDPVVELLIAGGDVAITDACMSAPNYQGKNDCVNKRADKSKAIMMCWARNSVQECDYYDPSQNPGRIFVPFKGSVDVDTPAPEVLQGSLSISLLAIEGDGGHCEIFDQQNVDFRDWQGAGKKHLSFDYPASRFDTNVKCLGQMVNYLVHPWLNARIRDFGDGKNRLAVSFTSDPGDVGNPNRVVIPKIRVMDGCVAKGTLIRTKNGEKAVEEIKADDFVETRNGYRKVISPTTGKEESLLKIVTEDGKTLEVTRSHPMILGNGVQLIAEKLRVDDELVTYASNGQSTLTKIKSVGYPKDDKGGEKTLNDVFNLVLEPSKDGTPGTYYANGILTGDASLQTELKYASHRAPQLTEAAERASIPARYLEDYDNARK